MKMEQRKNNQGADGNREALNGQVPSSFRLWTKKDTANVLHVEIKTLENWRVKGLGPPFVRLGGPRGRVFYRETDLRNYIESAVRNSTSDQGPLGTNEN